MPIEERTARNKKSIEKFENWWNSMSRNTKLDMIADQVSELEMLETYNKSEIGKSKKSSTATSTPTQENNKAASKKAKGKVDSSLSKDDLFKIWAGNNLKLFEASLTEYDKRKVAMRREQKRAEWWDSMSSSERTEYINRLKASSEPIRYAMIDAWNKNPDILAALSITMKQAHIEKPLEVIFGTDSFNQYMSQIMTDFWTSNPEFATRWGESIRDSHKNIKDAVENGRFELLKREIMKSRSQREKDILSQIKNHREILSEEEYNNYPTYIQKFIDAYLKEENSNIELLPVEYLKDFFKTASTDLTEEQVLSWTKAINRENLSSVDYKLINDINSTESTNAAIMNRALEATLAEVLYECTKNPQVYLLSQADCKMALGQIKKGYPYIAIGSLKLEREFNFPIINRNVDADKIEKLYKNYKGRITKFEAINIINQYFKIDLASFANDNEKNNYIELLIHYLMIYGNSSKIIFGEDSPVLPAAQQAFAEKFLNNMPIEIDKNKFNMLVKTEKDFEREKEIHKVYQELKSMYNFLPEKIFNTYFVTISKILRTVQEIKFDKARLMEAHNNSNAIIVPRTMMSFMNRINFLCAEQAISDKLYEATNEPKVYALKLEELIKAVKQINLTGKNHKEKINIDSKLLNETITLAPKKRVILFKQDDSAEEYCNEMTAYINELKSIEEIDKQEFLYILNPDENAQDIDKYTLLRINNF